ncbi:MAG: ThuA domain-containing protein [Clostridia bacterium]|nr:ThuA domain-containing protein [Clostridia bacterium]
MIRVTVWNEFYHEREMENVKAIYPEGIHKAIADFLGKEDDIEVRTATLIEENCGLSDEILESTDVLIWWGHAHHNDVPDELVAKIRDEVLKGMGMIFLHSAHHSKPFKALMGTSCNLSWRDGESERIWVVDPGHPIAQGLGKYFEIPHEEMYGEPFGIPEPDKLVFLGWYGSGEVFRSGCCYRRENGRIFYFQPGHESNPTYHIPEVQTVIKNAVRWAAPVYRAKELVCPCVKAPGHEND